MQGITIANGYQTDIGASVHDWPVRVQGTKQADELPLLGVYDVEGTTQRDSFDAKKTQRQLTIQLRCYIRKDTPSRELRKIIGDIEQAISVDERWNKLAVATMPSREGVVIESENFETSAVAVEIVIHYLTCAFNSYEG
jgi:hypothetical protein